MIAAASSQAVGWGWLIGWFAVVSSAALFLTRKPRP